MFRDIPQVSTWQNLQDWPLSCYSSLNAPREIAYRQGLQDGSIGYRAYDRIRKMLPLTRESYLNGFNDGQFWAWQPGQPIKTGRDAVAFLESLFN